MDNESYSRDEVLAAGDSLPARGPLCHHCNIKIPQFRDLSEADERRIRQLIRDDRRIMATQELKFATGCSLRWAKIWVLHKGRPEPLANVVAPCPYCGKPLRTSLAQQCRFCRQDWHNPKQVTTLSGFSIRFISGPNNEFNEPSMRGLITLGEFSEEFVAPLAYWTAEDYRKQWAEAARRIVNGAAHSCFVTAMRASPANGAMFLWAAYRLDDTVYFQEKLLIEETAIETFDPLNLYAQVDEQHRTETDDGNQISEWRVSVSDIKNYLQKAKAAHKDNTRPCNN